MQSRHKYKFIEDQVIKTQDKGIKFKNDIPRYMRSKSWIFVKFINGALDLSHGALKILSYYCQKEEMIFSP